MSNSRNFFLEDVIPYILVITAAVYYLIKRKENAFNEINTENVIENLLNALRNFEHGEGMLMNLNRLSLFITNINFDAKSECEIPNEVRNRISEIVEEYKNIVQPELKKIYSFCIQLGHQKLFVKYKSKYLNLGETILELNEKIRYDIELFIKIISMLSTSYGEIEKLENIKVRFDLNTKTIMAQFLSIKEIIKANYKTDVSKVVSLLLKKYSVKEKYNHSIKYLKNDNETSAFIAKTELNGVLSNLIQNSIEEFEKDEINSGEIIITSFSIDDSIFLSVEDNGKGILPGHEELIFSYNFTTKNKGHGFGLKYSKRILNKYDGKIKVDSSSSLGGAKFIIELRKV